MLKVQDRTKFYRKFKCEDDCREFLFALKWKDGYQCYRCGSSKSRKGKTAFHLRCTKCGYDESVTANSAFHKLKIPLLKAFGLAFEMIVSKKGKSSNALRNEFKVNPKAAYAFRNKAHRAIELRFAEDVQTLSDPNLVIDGVTITKRDDGLNGFQRITVNMKTLVSKDGKKDSAIAVHLLPLPGAIDHSRLIGGKFKEKGGRLLLWNFKTWLTGTHHHCSLTHFGGYLSEFFFRYIHRHCTDEIWYLLIELLMVRKPNKIITPAV